MENFYFILCNVWSINQAEKATLNPMRKYNFLVKKTFFFEYKKTL